MASTETVRGILDLSRVSISDSLEIETAYDTSGGFDVPDTDEPLTPEQKIQIAREMSKRWERYAQAVADAAAIPGCAT